MPDVSELQQKKLIELEEVARLRMNSRRSKNTSRIMIIGAILCIAFFVTPYDTVLSYVFIFLLLVLGFYVLHRVASRKELDWGDYLTDQEVFDLVELQGSNKHEANSSTKKTS